MTESKGKILVVDDDVPVAEMLAEHLTELGYQVISAHGGIEALTKLDLEKPHVILLDVRMPEMDGVEVLRRIRSFDSKVGILMITGNDDVDLAKETIELGAFDYLLKPPSGTPSAHAQLYDLALEIFRATRALSPVARESVGRELEHVALYALQRGVGGEKPEVIRALNQVRTVLRFAKDLGDMSDDTHRALDAYVARARRSVGLI
ncbi:MAG: hypothetical protein DMD77_18760 [Candidatus Rokuibacteriota bacterium]|nr:MAG: hypothetical protein DMD77_18760 [Candidatus Rokubacteria bacterium]